MICKAALLTALVAAQPAVDQPVGPPTSLSLRIISISGPAITVEISNDSGKAVRLFTESNTWGADRWRVVDIGANGVKSFFMEVPEAYTRNVPETFSIPSGGKWKRNFLMTGKEWSSSNKHSWSTRPGDTVLVEYDLRWEEMPGDQEGVWHGFLVAAKKVE